MASTRRLELLLTSNVENLGIVGDIIRVRMGYARNYLLPMGLAEVPSPEKIEALAAEREVALKEYKAIRSEQSSIIDNLAGIVLTLSRSANDQGGLYGSVTQRDIADALIENGYTVDTRAVRLHQAIRRIGDFHVTIQFGSDLKADIEVQVLPDRPLENREDMEFDDEGNLIVIEKQEKTPVNESVEAEVEVSEKEPANM